MIGQQKFEEGGEWEGGRRTAVMQFCQMMAEFREFLAQGKHAGEVLEHIIDEWVPPSTLYPHPCAATRTHTCIHTYLCSSLLLQL